MPVYHDFFLGYPDPDQRFLMWIRIRIRQNDTDPTGSESETLKKTIIFLVKLLFRCFLVFKIRSQGGGSGLVLQNNDNYPLSLVSFR